MAAVANNSIFQDNLQPNLRTYYWGEMNEEEGNKVLEGKPSGSFIIYHNLQTNTYMVCFVNQNNTITHFRLFYNSPGMYKIQTRIGYVLQQVNINQIIQLYDKVQPLPYVNPAIINSQQKNTTASQSISSAYGTAQTRTGRLNALVRMQQPAHRVLDSIGMSSRNALFPNVNTRHIAPPPTAEVIDIIRELSISKNIKDSFGEIKNAFILYDIPVVNCTIEQATEIIENDHIMIVFIKVNNAYIMLYKPIDNTPPIAIYYLKVGVILPLSDSYYTVSLPVNEKLRYNKKTGAFSIGSGREIYGNSDQMLAYMNSMNSIHKAYEVINGVIIPYASHNPLQYKKGGRRRSKRSNRSKRSTRKHRK